MNTFALKTSLSALLVAVPLAGAYADNVRGELPEFLDRANVDRTYTSSVGSAEQEVSLSRQLDAQIAAAQANLVPDQGGFANPAAAAQAQAELLSIRQAAAAEVQANGGALSDATYNSLSARVQSLQQTIRAATNG
jgi:hypothetical protein